MQTSAPIQTITETDKPPRPSNLPAANRRFFARRTIAQTLQDADVHSASIPLAFAKALQAENADVVLSLSATINPNGTLTILAAPLCAATSYSLLCTLLTTLLNSSVLVGSDTYRKLFVGPTTTDIVIHGLPVYSLPEDPLLLSLTIFAAVKLSCGAIIAGARFLQRDPSRRTGRSTSIILSFPLKEVKRVSSTIVLFSRPRKVEKM